MIGKGLFRPSLFRLQMYEEVRKPPKQSVPFRFFQHAFGTQASCPDPFSLFCEGMRKGSEGSGPHKESRTNALPLPLRIGARTNWTFCRTVWTSFPDMFLTRAYTPRLWPLVSTILRPWIYTPRSIGLHSTLHRPTLHGASAYAPRCVRPHCSRCVVEGAATSILGQQYFAFVG